MLRYFLDNLSLREKLKSGVIFGCKIRTKMLQRSIKDDRYLGMSIEGIYTLLFTMLFSHLDLQGPFTL